jgi:hypothetical protein
MPDLFISSAKKRLNQAGTAPSGNMNKTVLAEPFDIFLSVSDPAGFMKKRHSALFAECRLLFGSRY